MTTPTKKSPTGLPEWMTARCIITHLPAGAGHVSYQHPRPRHRCLLRTAKTSRSAGGAGTNKRMLALALRSGRRHAVCLRDLVRRRRGVFGRSGDRGPSLRRARQPSTLTGENVFAADTAADGTIYILGVDGSDNATLYTTDPAGGTTSIGAITLGAGVTGAKTSPLAPCWTPSAPATTLRSLNLVTLATADDSDRDNDDPPAPAVVPPPTPAPAPAPTPEPAPEPDTKELQEQVGSQQEREAVPEPLPEADALILPEPEQPGDPALITQPWVVVVMALAVLAVFGVVFGVVLRRERKLGANR